MRNAKQLTIPIALATCHALPSIALAQLAPCETQRLVPPVLSDWGEFGGHVEMNGRHMIVADWRDGALAVPAGSYLHGGVQAYQLNDASGQWELIQTIYPADIDAGHLFGYHIDLDGDRLIVGGTGSDLGGSNAGAAYVFDFDGAQWVETGVLLPSEPEAGGGFGERVAISGGFAAVTQSGAVYAYEQVGRAWNFVQRLDTATPPGTGTGYGVGLAIDGEWIVVGEPLNGEVVVQGGAAYAYRRDGEGVYALEQVLRPEGTPDRIQMFFGESLDLDSSRLVAGAPRDSRGAIYVLVIGDGTWELEQRLAYMGPDTSTHLGNCVHLHSDFIAAGASFEDPFGTGAGYTYRRSPDGMWQQVLRSAAATPTAGFGDGAATNGRFSAFGASNEWVLGTERDPLGAVHVYDLSCAICAPDLDADGALTVFDFLLFLNLFQDANPIADFDGDGELTIFDFLAFQTAFAAGCG
ncbi:MAG: GC-type dockerin domain-anchored protein [Phycisphaerales bacterium JB060]